MTQRSRSRPTAGPATGMTNARTRRPCSRGEWLADGVVHGIGILAALAGSAWLLTRDSIRCCPDAWFSLAVYSLGLAGMLSASAAYNLAPPGRSKDWLRRIDHAMIFVMIAGTYTPLAIHRFDPADTGVALCAAVWAVALIGVGLKLAYPRRFEPAGLVLYLALGWAVLWVIEPLVASVSALALSLLAAGGIIYTIGVVFHELQRLRYHTVIWHGLVVVAAACHFAALTVEFVA